MWGWRGRQGRRKVRTKPNQNKTKQKPPTARTGVCVDDDGGRPGPRRNALHHLVVVFDDLAGRGPVGAASPHVRRLGVRVAPLDVPRPRHGPPVLVPFDVVPRHQRAAVHHQGVEREAAPAELEPPGPGVVVAAVVLLMVLVVVPVCPQHTQQNPNPNQQKTSHNQEKGQRRNDAATGVYDAVKRSKQQQPEKRKERGKNSQNGNRDKRRKTPDTRFVVRHQTESEQCAETTAEGPTQ